MFTWNFQYMSKVRLSETLKQLNLSAANKEVLIRIHTAIHLEEEAVDLARFIKGIVPNAIIVGTSTSAVIYKGKIMQNQCVISVTQMESGKIYSQMIPIYKDKNADPITVESLIRIAKEELIMEDTKLFLTFFSKKYLDVSKFVVAFNDFFHDVQMIGGIPDAMKNDSRSDGFVFNETGWSDEAVIFASFSGKELESFSSCASGVTASDEELEMSEVCQSFILSINGKDEEESYQIGTIGGLTEMSHLAELFPYVYEEASEIPVYLRHSAKNGKHNLYTNCYLINGLKLKRGFINDRKIVADDRTMFRRVENFEKAEAIFAYTNAVRTRIYSNCAKWEVSAYENSNICGCVTNGEIAYCDGKNVFSNCSFVISVAGEIAFSQEFNPYAFSHTEFLAADNQEILNYLIDVEEKLEKNPELKNKDDMTSFVQECQRILLYSGNEELPNAAAMNMDIRLRGYDRICMINVEETAEMEKVFSKQMIEMTYKTYISKCNALAKTKKYHMYVIDKWHIAIGEPSYRVSLSQFVRDMEALQKELFEYSEELIAIVPIFCVIDGCTAENLDNTYYSARVDMMSKNMQFYVYQASDTESLDEASIRERYQMVNVINYAIANDGIVPFFQGIYDNKKNCIHHYEALMRLKDENGKIYYPNQFLDIARSYGLLYDAMSKLMIQKVFDIFRDKDGLSVSLNLGIRDIKNKEILDLIYEQLSLAPHPGNYVFEILENEDIDDYNALVAFVDRVHELGGLISIDDFGSGFSNLQHLLSIHSDYLKIDGSIVVNCCNSKDSENIIALIAGWKKLSSNKIGIVAEYVENEDIQKKLMLYDVDYSQGYLFSKPGPSIGQ